MSQNKSHTIINNNESLWGSMYVPLNPKPIKNQGLRTVLFVSCECGALMLRDLIAFETKYPDLLNIVGVVTDDPIDPKARISLKKRIWSQFSVEKRAELFQNLINTSINDGISCYSGAVKTDYFRKIFQEWNPEALLMFCYGQKIDAAIYEFPFMGAYNFHPSDLPKKIGAGTQPFQNAIQNGLKSSPMVIHKVTELIDVGPIVGVSPQISICLEDGSYPSSILTLLDKITSVGGWMGIALVAELIKIKESGSNSQVNNIDFEEIMPDDLKQKLNSPAVNDLNEKYEVSLHPMLHKK